jgi:squalene monooxygenase
MSSCLIDVVIAGGGIAGVSVAAALREVGFEVLVVEPGLNNAKRLAGELFHPPGVTDLAVLGLLDRLEATDAAPIHGFAVLPDAASEAYLLPYGDIPGLRRQGFAMEHGNLTAALLAAAERLSHVTVWRRARVTGVDLDHADFATVTVARDGRETQLRARLLVAADGAMSAVRRMAGIGLAKTRISRMSGYLVRGVRLPYPGFGNVCLGGPAPVLAYELGGDTTRVMFDVPGNPLGLEAPLRDAAYCDALPEPFRREVRGAMSVQTPLVSTNYSVLPETVFRGRLALVGDAAGCCHPLTATGLSVCTRDAIRLCATLRDAGGDIEAATRHYARLRAGPERTRVALAEALYRAFAGNTPEMRLLRQGILRFWKGSRRGRAASMALLSTHEGRMSMMALQYVRAVGYALIGLARRSGDGGGSSVASRRAAAIGLTRASLGLLCRVVRSS